MPRARPALQAQQLCTVPARERQEEGGEGHTGARLPRKPWRDPFAFVNAPPCLA